MVLDPDERTKQAAMQADARSRQAGFGQGPSGTLALDFSGFYSTYSAHTFIGCINLVHTTVFGSRTLHQAIPGRDECATRTKLMTSPKPTAHNQMCSLLDLGPCDASDYSMSGMDTVAPRLSEPGCTPARIVLTGCCRPLTMHDGTPRRGLRSRPSPSTRVISGMGVAVAVQPGRVPGGVARVYL